MDQMLKMKDYVKYIIPYCSPSSVRLSMKEYNLYEEASIYIYGIQEARSGGTVRHEKGQEIIKVVANELVRVNHFSEFKAIHDQFLYRLGVLVGCQ
jgi:hypothetical protein